MRPLFDEELRNDTVVTCTVMANDYDNPVEIVASLCDAIASSNEKLIKSVKGIGLKTAQRIIVDLKDRIVSTGIADELHVSTNKDNTPSVNTAVKDEAVSALTMLGFSPAPSAKVVTEILTEQPELPVEMVVKEALKKIK